MRLSWMNARWQVGEIEQASTVSRFMRPSCSKGKWTSYKGLADEIRVKGRQMIAWMGLAMMVSTRLWVAGVVSQTRDHHLADRLLMQVHACALPLQALLVATDGWAAYPRSIPRAFREKVKETAGRGRACLRVWKDLCIVTVIKRAEKKHVVEVTRRVTLGKEQQANKLLKQSQGGSVWNTAFIERLNGTARERLAVLTRKCRHAAHRLAALESRYPQNPHQISYLQPPLLRQA
jgi:IS1 family transposase